MYLAKIIKGHFAWNTPWFYLSHIIICQRKKTLELSGNDLCSPQNRPFLVETCVEYEKYHPFCKTNILGNGEMFGMIHSRRSWQRGRSLLTCFFGLGAIDYPEKYCVRHGSCTWAQEYKRTYVTLFIRSIWKCLHFQNVCAVWMTSLGFCVSSRGHKPMMLPGKGS